MKKVKVLALIGLVFSILLITGCGESNKKRTPKDHSLVCNLEQGTQSNYLEVQFNKDETKIENIYIEMHVTLNDSIDKDHIEISKNQFLESCKKQYKNCKVELEDKELIQIYEADPETMEFCTECTIDDVKKDIELDGFTCKKS